MRSERDLEPVIMNGSSPPPPPPCTRLKMIWPEVSIFWNLNLEYKDLKKCLFSVCSYNPWHLLQRHSDSVQRSVEGQLPPDGVVCVGNGHCRWHHSSWEIFSNSKTGYYENSCTKWFVILCNYKALKMLQAWFFLHKNESRVLDHIWNFSNQTHLSNLIELFNP